MQMLCNMAAAACTAQGDNHSYALGCEQLGDPEEQMKKSNDKKEEKQKRRESRCKRTIFKSDGVCPLTCYRL